MLKSLLILIVIAAVSPGLLSLSHEEKKVTAVRSSELITLDGKLDESVWKTEPVSDFTQRDPVEGAPVTEKTLVWVAYDDANLYIAARLFDSKPELIKTTISRRDDDNVQSDWFFVFIDSYLDKKNGLYFGTNPGGSILDGTCFNDNWDDNSWDGIWERKTSIDSYGWSVEIKIPFSQFRFSESENMTWGINFRRDIKRNNELAYFVMVPKTENGFVSKFALLEGLSGIKPKQRFEILPYLVQKSQFLLHDANDPFYKQNQFRTSLGADLKIGIGSNLNLDVAINPDFGQVEVDPAVVNLSAFETFYEEKRPFFIEGSNFFLFGLGGINNNWGFNFGWPELFYTRRIGRSPRGDISDNDFSDYPGETTIIGAGKLTGKLNTSTSVAALSAVTGSAYAKLNTNGIETRELVEPLSHYGIFRTKKEFDNGNQALGFIFTSVNRNLESELISKQFSKNSFTYGLDGWTNIGSDSMYVLAGALAGTYTSGSKDYMIKLQKQPYRYFQRPDAKFARLDSNLTSLSGYYGRLMLNKQKGNCYLNAALGLISPGFENNDLGAQWMADRINGHLVFGYRWYEPDNIFRYKSVILAHARSFDYDGNTGSNFLWSASDFQFVNYWSLSLNCAYAFPSLNKTMTRGGPLYKEPASYQFNISVSTDSREKVFFSISNSFQKSDLNEMVFAPSFSVNFVPNSQLNIAIGPEYFHYINNAQWIDNFYDPTAVNTFSHRYVFGEMKQEMLSANIRVNWTFTPALSLQLFLQPLLAVGSFSKFSELSAPGTNVLDYYGENGSEITFDNENDEFIVDPDGAGPAEKFVFSNPDFNFKSLKANVVLRWEALPGSILYLVWTHNRVNLRNPGDFSIKRDFSDLWRSGGDNVLLLKFSYWLDI
ncbi:MAG: DUF5916 domain-containing protein [Ignavibacteriaceae bacterium]